MGPMENIMDILHITNKVDMIYALEKFHMYNETKINNQINDKCTVRPNIVYDMLILKYTKRGQSPLQLPLPIITSLNHKLQHSEHVRIRPASQLHNKLYFYMPTHMLSVL